MRGVRRPLAVLLALAAALALAGPAHARPGGLAGRLAQALAVPHLDHAREGALAVDLATGRIVFSRNADRALAPASTEKVPVTYASLVAFGPGYRIRTAVYGKGEQVGSTWDGVLVLKGFGDPTLSTADLRVLAEQVRDVGIRRVTGGIRTDETFFDTRRTGPGWKSYFFIEESPPLSALVADRARSEGRIAYDPALSAGRVFRRALVAAGVKVPARVSRGRAPEDQPALATVLSPPLAALVRDVNTESDNFVAELLLKQLGTLVQIPGSTASGAEVVEQILEASAVPVEGMTISDGSGLSSFNRISARTLVGILEAAWLNPDIRGAFVASLAVAGRTGTLEERLRGGPAWGAVLAKTGTTHVSSSLAGYVRDRYVFAVLHNGSPVATSWARKAQDRFVTALARQ